MNLLSIIILAWLQLIISAPFHGTITFVFDSILAAATSSTIEEQMKESRIGIIKHVRRMSNSITHGIRRMSNTNIGNITSSITSSITDARRLTSSVKSTITVDSDFFRLRRSVIERLRDNANDTIVAGGGHSTSSNGNNTTSSHDDYTSTDKTSIILKRCNDFVKAFIRHRDSLNDEDKSKFDESWSFLYTTTTSINTTRTTSSSTPSSIAPYNPNENDIRFMNMSKVVYSEIDKVYSRSRKVIGTTTTATTIITLILILLESIENAPPHVASAILIQSFLVDLLGTTTTYYYYYYYY